MAKVEVYEGDDPLEPLFIAAFATVPRVGEHLAREMGGYFNYYNVVKVWHRQQGEAAEFRACIDVELDD